MYQTTYVFNGDRAPDDVKRELASDPRMQHCTSHLAVMYEPDCDAAAVAEHVRMQREILPDAAIVGMTTIGPIGPEITVPRELVVSVLSFEDSDFEVHLIDCHDIEPAEAGSLLCERIADVENVKGILLFAANAELATEPFIERIQECRPDVEVFGAQAGTEVPGNDQSKVFAGDEICDCGILAVVLYGENLHIHAGYNLGWHPIGREMTITETDGAGRVKSIDGLPAADVYRRYLGIDTDGAFYSNVCSFPLLTSDRERLIARVPSRFEDDGSLIFPSFSNLGAKFTFSYAKPEYLLRGSLESANGMARFAPNAILLFGCINRKMCLGEKRTERELSYFRRICPELSYAYGMGEILRTPEGNELMHSTLVAVGLREGDAPQKAPAEPLTDPELSEEGMSYKPLSDRLVTFLEATTEDLNQMIGELQHAARHDQLTGVYNRRYLDKIITQRLSKHRRSSDQGLAVLMYDIDHFKNVNDTYGHDVGDTVLKELTQCVQNSVRADDIIGRWGGEEFLILLSNTTLELAAMLAERIRKRVEATEFSHVGTMTISFGVTRALDDDTEATLFDRVDRALYEAKNSGRNCVVAR